MKAGVIVGLIFATIATLVAYLLLDSGEDLRAYLKRIGPETERTALALAECGELVRYLDARKPTQRKKIELDELRGRVADLDRNVRAILDDPSRDRIERKRELERLASEECVDLRADAEDLRARLREMKSFDADLRPAVAELGRLRRALSDSLEHSTDLVYQQRAQELIQESREHLKLAEDGMARLSASIVEGRPIGRAALAGLRTVLGHMKSLMESAGVEIPAAGASEGS